MPSYRRISEQPAWGLYDGPELLATVRSATWEGAVSSFNRLPKGLRGGIEVVGPGHVCPLLERPRDVIQ